MRRVRVNQKSLGRGTFIFGLALLGLLTASGCGPDYVLQGDAKRKLGLAAQSSLNHDIQETEDALAASAGRGAQALPDTSYLSYAENKPCTYYVAENGNDLANGYASTPWQTVGKAIRTLDKGQVACVAPGTYKEVRNMTARSGTATAPIVIRASDPTKRPELVLNIDGWNPLIQFNHSYWVVDGLRFNGNRKVTTVVHMSDTSSHVTLRNSEVYNSGGGAGVSVYGKDIFVYKVDSHDNFQVNKEDSHAFHTFFPAARVLFKNVNAYNNSGDGFQCEQYNSTLPNVPTDITFDGGEIYTDPVNFGSTEQAFDIKQCHRVTIRNIKARGWRWKTTNSGGQCGLAFVVHVGATNVLIENNTFSDAEGAGNIHHEANSAFDVTFRNNIVRDIKNVTGKCAYGLYVGRAQNVEVYNNTFDGIPKAAIHNAGPSTNVDIFSNIIQNSYEWIRISSADTESDYNLFYDSNGSVDKLCTSGCTSLGAWQGTGRDKNSLYANPMFLSDGSYYTAAGSPARDSAFELNLPKCQPGQNQGCFCGLGRDRGAKESACNTTTASPSPIAPPPSPRPSPSPSPSPSPKPSPAPSPSPSAPACTRPIGNLSISKATASLILPFQSATAVLDNNYRTGWICLRTGCYVTLDLGSVKTVTAAQVAWLGGSSRRNSYAISVSETGSSYEHLASGQSSGTSSGLETYSISKRRARYVRITLTGSQLSALSGFTEARVRGELPCPRPPIEDLELEPRVPGKILPEPELDRVNWSSRF